MDQVVSHRAARRFGFSFAAPSRIAVGSRGDANSRRTISARTITTGAMLLALAISFALAVGTPCSAVQNAPTEDPANAGDSIFIPAPRELTRPIELAWRDIEQRRYAEAVARLGEVMFSDQADNYFVPSPDQPGLWLSLGVFQQMQIDRLPAEAREAFELKFGIEAQQLLDQAITRRDWNEIQRIANDFQHCRAGRAASMLLGRRLLDQGRTMEAARQFQRVLDSEEGRSAWSPEVQLLTATALLASGRFDEVDAALATLPANWQARIGGSELEGATTSAVPAGEGRSVEVRTWLSERIGSVPALAAAAERNWSMFRGNAQRNGSTSPGFPLPIDHWRVPTLLSAEDRALAQAFKRSMIDEGRITAPAVNALAVGDYVVMRTADYLIGVELSTGLRTFYYPWDEGDAIVDRGEPEGPQAGSPRLPQLQERLWMDGVHGQMSSDGRSVWFVDDLEYRLADLQRNRLAVIRGQSPETVPNRLVSLRLYDDEGRPTEGKMQWILGGGDGGDQEWSAGVFFLGPPLPHDGVLYVLGEKQSEIRIYAVAEDDAELLWNAQIGVVGVGGLEERVVRQIAGASPSLSGTQLICPTSTGAIVAVDLISRTPIWGYQYRGLASGRNNFAAPQAWRPGERFADAAALISSGVIVLAPVEFDSLLGIDLVTGHLLWRVPRQDASYVAGAEDGIVVVAGERTVRGIRTVSGEQVWERSLADWGSPSGRGYLAGGRFFLPTVRKQVIALSVADGSIVDSIETEFVLGNLICHRGEVISHDIDWVAAFPQDESNRPIVAGRLAADPDDRGALLLEAQLAARDRQWDRAITAAERAYALDPDSLDAERTLIRILMLASRSDEIPIDRIAAHEGMILGSEYRNDYLMRKLELLDRSGDVDGMIGALLLIVQAAPALADDQPPLMVRDGRVEFSADIWAELLLRRSVQAGRTPSATTLAALESARRAAVEAFDIDRMRRFDRIFGQIAPDPEFRLTLARMLARAERPGDAEAVLVELFEAPAAEVRVAALLQAVELLKTGRFDGELGAIAQRLIDEGEGISDENGIPAARTGADLLANVPSRRAVSTGRLAIETSDRADIQLQPTAPLSVERFVGPLVPRGLRFAFWNFNFHVADADGSQRGSVSVADGAGWALRSNSRVQLLDHLVIVDVSFGGFAHELVAIDLFRLSAGDPQPFAWRHRLWGDAMRQAPFSRTTQQARFETRSNALGITSSRLVYENRQVAAYSEATREGIVVLRDETATCLDPHTGEVRWKRSGMPPGGKVVAEGDRCWIIAEDGKTVSSLSLADGSELPGREIAANGTPVFELGSKQVSLVATADSFRLSAIDLGTGENAWNLEMPSGARAATLSGTRLALLEPEGRFRIVDLDDGTTLFESTVSFPGPLGAIQVFEDEYGLLLVAARNTASGRLGSRMHQNVDLMQVQSPLIDGSLFAFAPDGSALWPGPVAIGQYSLMGSEIGKGPILVFSRAMQLQIDGNPTPVMDLAVVDRRDGRLLWEESGIMTKNLQNWTVTRNRETGKIEITGGKRLELTPTDEPLPPAPAARIGADASGVTGVTVPIRRIRDGIGPTRDPQ